MAKYCGIIGFVETIETPEGSGKWKEVLTKRVYRGDLIRNIKRYESGTGQNDDLNVSNRISIVSDPYCRSHFSAIRYIEWLGAKWKVTSVEVEYPRLILDIGGVYNGDPS